MEIYLTSSPFAGHEDPAQSHTDSANREISDVNDFEERLEKSAKGCKKGLFIAADPDNAAATDGFSRDMKNALDRSGIHLETWKTLDRRNAGDAAKLVGESDFIVLAGGHTPTQNRFFREIRLKELLEDKNGAGRKDKEKKRFGSIGVDGLKTLMGAFGVPVNDPDDDDDKNERLRTAAMNSTSGKCVLLGISAGSMNAASTVYAQPEEEGESVDPKYERFMPGLGLTDVMIIPHYQRIKDRILDGKRLFEDITVPDSMGRYLYLLSDGSYLYTNGDISRIYGELHIMKDGVIRKVAGKGGTTALIDD